MNGDILTTPHCTLALMRFDREREAALTVAVDERLHHVPPRCGRG